MGREADKRNAAMPLEDSQVHPDRSRDHPPSDQSSAGGKPTDFLANERTFLAWIRTGVALVALGFVVAKFGLLLRELAPRGAAAASKVSSNHISSVFGAGIVVLSAALLTISYIRYVRVGRALARGEYRDSRWLAAVMTAMTVVIALLLAIYLLFT